MPGSLWSSAVEKAARTPSTRNRAVDLLRALSILVVVFGHWLLAAPWVDADGAHIDHLLARAEWTQWLTWLLQVMPVFFFVGGYSNGASWDAAQRDSQPYSAWLADRMRRLLRPVLVLILFWAVAAVIATAAGIEPPMIRVGSQVAFIPTWFLAVYSAVVLLAPAARNAWKRWGMISVWSLALLAMLGDLVYFGLGLHGPGWVNYLFVWLAVHQLGFAWLDGVFRSRVRAATWCCTGLALLVVMTELGPWPRSLVGVPGESVSNTTPPHLPILALTAFQFGAVMLAEARLRRMLDKAGVWTATVLINGMIMTIFLWHNTAMVLLFGAAILLGGVGLHADPASGVWWLARLPWLAVFLVGMLPLLGLFSRFERPSARSGPPPAAWRQVMGTLLACLGLALLAYHGVSDDGPLGLRVEPLLLTFGGFALLRIRTTSLRGS